MTDPIAFRPKWLRMLAQKCTETSQAKVAARLRQADGFPSPAVINQVIKGKYPSARGIERLRNLFEGAYLGHTVDCPILGDLARDACLRHQSRPFAATNPMRVQLYRACRNGCPHSRLEETQ